VSSLDCLPYPRTFTGEYEPELNSKGLTPVDWYALVGARSGSYMAYVLSVRFLVAFNMERVLLPSSPSLEVYRSALTLLRKSNLEWDTDTLSKILQSALQHESTDVWGFESQGDGRQVVTDLMSLIRAISPLRRTERTGGRIFSGHKLEPTATDRRENTGFLKGNCLSRGQRNSGLARLSS
jgi:hypothetical protein